MLGKQKAREKEMLREQTEGDLEITFKTGERETSLNYRAGGHAG